MNYFCSLIINMIEIPTVKERRPVQRIDLYAYSLIYTHIHTVRYQPLYKHVVTRVQTHPFPPFLPPHSLSLSPLGHRRSTIDASSLPARARIYGNVYAGRSYIRGFWRITYIREILITPSLLPPSPSRHTHTICESASSGKGNTVPWYRPMGLSFALYWRSVSLPSDLSIFRRPCLPVSPFATRSV